MPLVLHGRQLAGDHLHSLVHGLPLQGAVDIGDVHLVRHEGGQARDALWYPAELQFFVGRGMAPMLLHPFVQHVRADLALDELKGASAHHLLPVELFAPGIPTRLTLHDQVGVGGDHIEKLWHRLLEVKDDLVVVTDLHALCDFPEHLLDAI